MKRTLLILSFVVTLFVAGVLLENHLQTDKREAVTLEETYMAQYPEQMPDIDMDSIVGLLLY